MNFNLTIEELEDFARNFELPTLEETARTLNKQKVQPSLRLEIERFFLHRNIKPS